MAKGGPTNPGYLKPNTLKRSRLMHVEVPNGDGMILTKVEDKEEV
jgi:hypothetical protein